MHHLFFIITSFLYQVLLRGEQVKHSVLAHGVRLATNAERASLHNKRKHPPEIVSKVGAFIIDKILLKE